MEEDFFKLMIEKGIDPNKFMEYINSNNIIGSPKSDEINRLSHTNYGLNLNQDSGIDLISGSNTNLQFGNELFTDNLIETGNKELNSDINNKVQLFDNGDVNKGNKGFTDFLKAYRAINPNSDVDLNTSLFKFGQSLSFDPSEVDADKRGQAKLGNNIVKYSSGLKSLLNIGRQVGAGMGANNRQQFLNEYYNKKQREGLVNSNIKYVEDGGLLNFLKNGGDIQDYNNGDNVIKELNKDELHKANVEVEHGEYIKDVNGVISRIEGKKHEDGGVKLNLENGTLVLSNNLKVNKDMIPKLKEEFGIKVSSKDTFANVIDKFKANTNISKLDKEYNDIVKKLENQKDINDKPTSSINSLFLSSKLDDIKQQKDIILAEKDRLFNTLFSKQEESKVNKYKNGGISIDTHTLSKLSKKYNLPKDEIVKIFNTQVTIKESDKFPDGGKFKKVNKYFKKDYKKQHRNESDPRIFDDFDLRDRLDEYKKLFPNLITKYYKKNENNFYVPLDENSAKNFQKDYNKYLSETGNYFTKLGFSKDEIDKYIGEQRFLNKDEYKGDGHTSRLIDNLLGQITTSRSGFKRNIIPEDKINELHDKGIFTARQLIDNKSDSIKILGNDLVSSINNDIGDNPYIDYSLDIIDNTNNSDNINSDSKQTQIDNNADNNYDNNIEHKVSRSNYLYMPDQSTPPPVGVTPHLKIQRRYEKIDPVKLTPEESLKEIFRSENTAFNLLGQAPDSQRQAILSNITANTQVNTNKAISSTELANAQSQFNADSFNINQSNNEENARAIDALDFERRQLTAVAKTQADLDNYFEFNRKIKLNEFNDRRKFDLLNSLYENYNISNNGGIEFDRSKKIQFYVNKGVSLPNAIKLVDGKSN